MDDQQFHEWFSERAEAFAEIGVMHPKSEWGKIVRICLEVSMQDQVALKKKIESLEKKILKLEKVIKNEPDPAPKRKKSK